PLQRPTPPTPPLLPYTTLFRSLAEVVAGIDLEHLSAGDHKLIESSRFGGDEVGVLAGAIEKTLERISAFVVRERDFTGSASHERSEEHTSELQSRENLVCRLLL